MNDPQTPSDEAIANAVFGNRADLPVTALANDEIVSASVDVTIRDASRKLDEAGVGLLVLRDDSGVQGVVSERDIVRAVATGADLDGSVEQLDSGQPIRWAASSSTVADVAEEMMESYVRHILVADENGDLAAVVSVRDLLAVVLD